MKIQGNLIIFRMEEAERKDVRRLPEKKLQLLLDENNQFPAFPIDNQTPIKPPNFILSSYIPGASQHITRKPGN